MLLAGGLPGWLLVALGSAIGGVARYGAMRLWPIVPGQWPTATMAVKLLGSFLIGVLSVLLAGQGLEWRAGAYLLVTVFGCAAATLAGRALASMMILET